MHKKTVKYIAFLSSLGGIPALTTDMYLAAIPKIAAGWHVSTELINMTLTLWFVSFSIGLLFSGSLSDKYGRKPILLIGLMGFIGSSLLCGISTNPIMLITSRILQGVSASAPSAISLAICRERFIGSTRKIALAYLGIMLSLAPIIAPSLGSLILMVSSWRFIFICQAFSGIVIFIMTLKYTETNKSPLVQPLIKLLGRYMVLFKNKRYIIATLTLGMLLGPFYGNIAFSPIVYIEIFKRSDFEFSMLFALTAACSILGAFIMAKLNNKISDITLISICFIGIIAAGIGLLAFGKISYLSYFLCAAVIAFFSGMSRPISNHLILGFVNTDIGSASSFLVFYQFIFGAICMSYASYQWKVMPPVMMFGVMVVIVSLFSILIWQGVKRLVKEVI